MRSKKSKNTKNTKNTKNARKPRKTRRKRKRTSRLQSLHYDSYQLHEKELLWTAAKTAGLSILIGYLFYDSAAAMLVGIPLYPLMCMAERQTKIRERKRHLVEAFKDAIVLLYSFVSTGNTLEQAFCRTADALLLSYQPEDDIVREFMEIRRKLDMNLTIEACMEDFADRSRSEDIKNFSEVIAVAKRGGGSMSAIIKNSVETIRVKIECENEIRTLVSSQSNEFKIMVIVPAAVLLYLRIFSSGFLDAVYGNLAGVIFMSVCLCVYLAAVYWGVQILQIRI